MWGTLVAGMSLGAVIRFIPTHVGNSSAMRTKEAINRFIPTHVGNSPTGVPVGRPAPVHPHACGELHRGMSR